LNRKTYTSKDLKVIVVVLSLTGRGGVSSVVASYAQAGLFNKNITCHESSGGDSPISIFLHAVYQFCKFPFKLVLRRPHLVHIHCSSGKSFYRKIPYVLISKLFGAKVLLHLHPSHFRQFYQNSPRLIRKLIYIILSLCDALAFVNSNLCKEFRTIFPNKPIFHLRNPVNTSAYYPLEEHNHRNNQALFLGAFTENKGVFDIIEAIPLIRQKMPDMTFVFCGDHRIDELRYRIERANLNGAVDIRFWVGYEEKLQLLQTSTMLLLPSYSEGFPMVILEAMACGLPVICSDVGGISEAVTDGESGLFVQPGDVNGLADRVVHLTKDKLLQSRLRYKGQEVVQRYDTLRLCEELKGVYVQVEEGERGRIGEGARGCTFPA